MDMTVKMRSVTWFKNNVIASPIFTANTCAWKRNFFPINATGMGRFQLLNLGVWCYGLELRFWVVIAIIVSLTMTITLITTLKKI